VRLADADIAERKLEASGSSEQSASPLAFLSVACLIAQAPCAVQEFR
jgi:hypothetical protein